MVRNDARRVTPPSPHPPRTRAGGVPHTPRTSATRFSVRAAPLAVGAVASVAPPADALPAVAAAPVAFYSHAWADKRVVKAFKARLDSLGLAGWIDHERLAVGDGLYEHIVQAIDGAPIFIAFWSRAYFASKSCNREYHLAAQWGKRIVPILIEDKPSPWPPSCSISAHAADVVYWIVAAHGPDFASAAFEAEARQRFRDVLGPAGAPAASAPAAGAAAGPTEASSRALVRPTNRVALTSLRATTDAVLAAVTSQLGKIVGAVATSVGNREAALTEDDAAVAASQSPELHRDAAVMCEMLKTLTDMFARVLNKADLLRAGVVKDVHFVRHLPRKAKLFVFPAHRAPTGVQLERNPTDELDTILNAECLVVTDAAGTYGATVEVIAGVQIEVLAATATEPHAVVFAETGSTYMLSDGYSVTYCRKLGEVETLRIGPAPAKRPRPS